MMEPSSEFTTSEIDEEIENFFIGSSKATSHGTRRVPALQSLMGKSKLSQSSAGHIVPVMYQCDLHPLTTESPKFDWQPKLMPSLRYDRDCCVVYPSASESSMQSSVRSPPSSDGIEGLPTPTLRLRSEKLCCTQLNTIPLVAV